MLASVTLLAYVRRDWVRHVEKKNAPPAAPVDVTRQSAGINFKKYGEQNQAIFEVAASKSTEFKGKDANLLEDVRITIFGKTGERHDVMHTRSCQYGKENGGIAVPSRCFEERLQPQQHTLELLKWSDMKRS